MNGHELHIGEMIRQELKLQRRSVAWLAMQLHCNRSNAYKILERKDVDTDLLRRVSHALNCDFFLRISQVGF
ncbi:MAG: XRE family transcriptional regulator [Paludibacteraceae bacterium]|nr:XRE family transcriptional regulator [Paludibacteraceae bacterium]